MLNYEVDPILLSKFVPSGTVLDSFQGRTYLSLVGFRFRRTELFDCFPVPFHTDFDEVNLRFYVRRRHGSEDRRGVVFIAEVVPRYAIALTARLIYGENYVCRPMRHRIEMQQSNRNVEYQWKLNSGWCRLFAQTVGLPTQPQNGSLEQFITEHYWGYSTQRDGGCSEYQVAHVPWQVWAATDAGFEGETSDLYGPDLATILHQCPHSAFVADGSPVAVFAGNKLDTKKAQISNTSQRSQADGD